MIDLNPLVIDRHSIPPPAHAAAEERECTWYSITDRIDYLPGGLASGSISYTCAFHDLPQGLQTHCFAPLGVELREKWTVAGVLPGEAPEPVEIGLDAPTQGLYLREDVELRCNVIMAKFVKKTLTKAHTTVVQRIGEKAKKIEGERSQQPQQHSSSLPASPYSQHGQREQGNFFPQGQHGQHGQHGYGQGYSIPPGVQQQQQQQQYQQQQQQRHELS